jgi:hypothetical protein
VSSIRLDPRRLATEISRADTVARIKREALARTVTDRCWVVNRR